MKEKLIKHILVKADKDKYFLFKEDDTGFRIQVCKKLSLKNCQAIERGFDLDKLIDEHFGKPTEEELDNESEFGYALYKSNVLEFKKGFQKALELMKHRLVEETEWQVEVLMDICGDKVYAVPEPKLDADGCLILKRI